MKIFAVDIGAGTSDFLLYDSDMNVENCIKFVLPSPTAVLAAKLKAIISQGKDIAISGDTIGGGILPHLLMEHIANRHDVYMTKIAAFTLYNRIERVKGMGIKIARPPKNFHGVSLKTAELNLLAIKRLLSTVGEDLVGLDAVAIAVQDHGAPPVGVNQNRFRLEKMREHLCEDPLLQKLLFLEEDIPRYYLRMRSAARAAKRQLRGVQVFVMDSVPAAMLGCLHDTAAARARSTLIVNVGNSHTASALLDRGKIVGLMEHHTSFLNGAKLRNYLMELAGGRLSNEKIFGEGGHGAFYISKPQSYATVNIVATGPRRILLKETGLKVNFAAPGGDTLMTGPLGLVTAVKEKLA